MSVLSKTAKRVMGLAKNARIHTDTEAPCCCISMYFVIFIIIMVMHALSPLLDKHLPGHIAQAYRIFNAIFLHRKIDKSRVSCRLLQNAVFVDNRRGVVCMP